MDIKIRHFIIESELKTQKQANWELMKILINL